MDSSSFPLRAGAFKQGPMQEGGSEERMGGGAGHGLDSLGSCRVEHIVQELRAQVS